MRLPSRSHSNPFTTTVRGLALAGLAAAAFALLLAIAPNLMAQSPVCTAGMQEAESGILYGFTVGSDTRASGGSYLHQADGEGSRWAPSTAYRAEYCLTVPADGLYTLEGGVWATDGTNDSFFVAVDGVMAGTGRWDIAHHVDYSADLVSAHLMADPTVWELAAGDHTVEVYLREDGARLDTIQFVEVQPPPAPACQTGWYQAEDGTVIGMSVSSRYISVPEGQGSHWFPDPSYSATYCFTVSEAGLYRINGRARADSNTSDSFFVQVDGGDVWTWFVRQSNRFRSDLVNDYLNDDPVEIWLEPGDHHVTVYAREDGTRLDRIRLEIIRPRECTTGRMEAEDAQVTGFDVGEDDNASNGEYVHAPDGSGSSWSPSEDTKVEFCFRVGTAGQYALQAGVWADAGTNDSFWVKVNGVTHGRWDTAMNTAYDTDMVGMAAADPMVLDLQPGNHTVEILLREDGTRLDWLELVPSGR